MTLLLALLIGVVAGLRAMTAPAAVSRAAYLGWINLSDSPAAFIEDAGAIVGARLLVVAA
jgi:uncharacterized membrane protein